MDGRPAVALDGLPVRPIHLPEPDNDYFEAVHAALLHLSAMAHLHHPHAPHTLNLDFGRAFGWGIALNLVYVAVEIGYGYTSGAMTLVSDGFHNLGDVAGMVLSWGAFVLMKRAPTTGYTYGYGRATILAAFLNALLLMLAVGGLGWEAMLRLRHPMPVPGLTIAVISAIGIGVNGFTAMLFFRDRNEDINLKSTYLHMASDAVVSLGALITGVVINYTAWWILDPLVSLAILGAIVYSTWGLLQESVKQILDHVPSNVDVAKLNEKLLAIPGVSGLHDLHVWSLNTRQAALTTHLLIDEGVDSNALLDDVTEMLHEEFGIEQTTIQVEYGAGLEHH